MRKLWLRHGSHLWQPRYLIISKNTEKLSQGFRFPRWQFEDHIRICLILSAEVCFCPPPPPCWSSFRPPGFMRVFSLGGKGGVISSHSPWVFVSRGQRLKSTQQQWGMTECEFIKKNEKYPPPKCSKNVDLGLFCVFGTGWFSLLGLWCPETGLTYLHFTLQGSF